MSKPDEYDSAGPEPKKQFISIILIPGMKQVGYFLRSGSSSDAIRTMRNDILNQLDGEDRTALKDQVKILESYELTAPRTMLELEHVWQNISAYLHTRYLREFLWAKPRNPVRGKLGDKPVEHNNGHE